MLCFAECTSKLKAVGLRPTRQRMALTKLLFGEGNRHVTAESLHAEALDADIKVSLATVYNTLNQLVESGLLRQITIDTGCTWYDTNTKDHYHFLLEDGCTLIDIDPESMSLKNIPALPDGTALDRVDIVLRLRQA